MNATFRGGTTRLRRTRAFRLTAALAVAAMLGGAAIAAGPVAPAFATDWPTWDEVREARADEKAAKAEVQRIQALLEQLRGAALSAQQEAETANDAYAAADQEYQEAYLKAEMLQAEADEAAAAADESQERAGMLVAQASRIGGGDIGASLLAEAGGADDLLQMLGRAGQLSEQTEAIYTLAVQDRNTARALTNDAEAAAAVREETRELAEAAFAKARDAAVRAQAAVDEEQARASEMEAQLAALTDRRVSIDTAWGDYQAEQERLRIQRERELAAQWGAGAGGTMKPGAVVNGWTWPTSGVITANFGYRPKPTPTSPAFHYGTDIANGCGVPIYAASGGAVEIVAYSPGGYGNYARIDHGGGVSTLYAHMTNGGVRVSSGQGVAPGQLIGYTGATGNVTGCHLHFEVRINGAVTDPVTFVRAKGAGIG